MKVILCDMKSRSPGPYHPPFQVIWLQLGNNIEELLVQFSFQLVRTPLTNELEDKYKILLQKIFNKSNKLDKSYKLKYIKLLLCFKGAVLNLQGCKL